MCDYTCVSTCMLLCLCAVCVCVVCARVCMLCECPRVYPLCECALYVCERVRRSLPRAHRSQALDEARSRLAASGAPVVLVFHRLAALGPATALDVSDHELDIDTPAKRAGSRAAATAAPASAKRRSGAASAASRVGAAAPSVGTAGTAHSGRPAASPEVLRPLNRTALDGYIQRLRKPSAGGWAGPGAPAAAQGGGGGGGGGLSLAAACTSSIPQRQEVMVGNNVVEVHMTPGKARGKCVCVRGRTEWGLRAPCRGLCGDRVCPDPRKCCVFAWCPPPLTHSICHRRKRRGVGSAGQNTRRERGRRV